MVRWAIKAGLIKGEADENTLKMDIPNQIQIVYEPDCAALSIQHAVRRAIDAKNKQIPTTTSKKRRVDKR